MRAIKTPPTYNASPPAISTTTDGSGIIYVNSRHKAESLAFSLREAGVAAEAYHAGIEQRGGVQDRFMSDKTRVVVATIAFGMGIDKSDIRFIVHFHPSRSLAAYYQEVGRAGRDGKPSQGVLFYSNNDWANLRRWAKADEYNVELLLRVLAAVATQLGIYPDGAPLNSETPITETASGPVDLRRLQQVLAIDETTLRVAVSMLERCDLLTRGFDIPQEIVITLPKKLPNAAKHDEEFARLQRGLALGRGAERLLPIVGLLEPALARPEAAPRFRGEMVSMTGVDSGEMRYSVDGKSGIRRIVRQTF